jgi:CIC family chloride channel protein
VFILAASLEAISKIGKGRVAKDWQPEGLAARLSDSIVFLSERERTSSSNEGSGGRLWAMDMPRTLIETRFGAARAYLRTHWREALRVREKLWLTEEAFHLVLAGCVGVIGGVANLFFYHAVHFFQWLAFGSAKTDAVEVAMGLPVWRMVAIPAVGGLLAGLVLFLGMRYVARPGSSNLIEVVVAGDGRLPFRNGVIRTLSSMLSIAFGASIGREGAITQIAATLASKWGQLARWQPYRLRLLVGCGAASGIAAAYNAPIAGAVFAAQIVLGNFSMSLFAPLLFSSVIASMLSRTFFGVAPWYVAPAYEFTSIAQLPWFLALGLGTGVLGAVFLKLISVFERFFQRVPTIYLRLAAGGLIVGGIAVYCPYVLGNGFYANNQILQNQFDLELVMIVLVAKLVATLVTVGSGAVGGVFTPTLFLGAGLGEAMGLLMHHFGLGVQMPASSCALVGMGCMLAATTRSPLLAIIMLLEISQNYSLMPALMIGCAVATLVARQLHPQSIYTQPLKIRSLEVESYRPGAATEQTVGDIMREPVAPVFENTPLPELADRFLGSTNNYLPVVDNNNRLRGVVSLHDLKGYLNAGKELQTVIAYDVMRSSPPCLTPSQKLLDTLHTLLARELKNVPVINTQEDRRLVGSVPRAEALGMLSELLASSSPTTVSGETEQTKSVAAE